MRSKRAGWLRTPFAAAVTALALLSAAAPSHAQVTVFKQSVAEAAATDADIAAFYRETGLRPPLDRKRRGLHRASFRADARRVRGRNPRPSFGPLHACPHRGHRFWCADRARPGPGGGGTERALPSLRARRADGHSHARERRSRNQARGSGAEPHRPAPRLRSLRPRRLHPRAAARPRSATRS